MHRQRVERKRAAPAEQERLTDQRVSAARLGKQPSDRRDSPSRRDFTAGAAVAVEQHHRRR
jgi:hypothetical protein